MLNVSQTLAPMINSSQVISSMDNAFFNNFWTLAAAVLALISAVVAAWLSFLYKSKMNVYKTKLERVEEQLKHLYGPVNTIMTASEKCWTAVWGELTEPTKKQGTDAGGEATTFQGNAGFSGGSASALGRYASALEGGASTSVGGAGTSGGNAGTPGERSNPEARTEVPDSAPSHAKIFQDVTHFNSSKLERKAAYKLYLREVFYPLSVQMVKIIEENSHLLCETSLPGVVSDYVAHVYLHKAVIECYKLQAEQQEWKEVSFRPNSLSGGCMLPPLQQQKTNIVSRHCCTTSGACLP